MVEITSGMVSWSGVDLDISDCYASKGSFIKFETFSVTDNLLPGRNSQNGDVKKMKKRNSESL